MLHLTLRICLRLANRPGAQFQSSPIKNDLQASYDPQASGTGTDFPAIQARVLVLPSLRWAYFEQETSSNFFPMIRSTRETKKLLPMSYLRASLRELCPMHDFLQTHLQEPDFFWFTSNGFLKRPVLLKYWHLRPISTR